jgi:hypothetical protein
MGSPGFGKQVPSTNKLQIGFIHLITHTALLPSTTIWSWKYITLTREFRGLLLAMNMCFHVSKCQKFWSCTSSKHKNYPSASERWFGAYLQLLQWSQHSFPWGSCQIFSYLSTVLWLCLSCLLTQSLGKFCIQSSQETVVGDGCASLQARFTSVALR